MYIIFLEEINNIVICFLIYENINAQCYSIMQEMFYIKLFLFKEELYNQREDIKDIIILKIENHTLYSSFFCIYIFFKNILLIYSNNK